MPDRGEIVVTGRGLEELPGSPAYSTRELDRAAIVSSASGRIEDVLTSVAGFQQFRRSDSRSSNPSAQGVTLRALGGNASSRALVVLDGVPMTDPFFGYVPFTALAPERLGSVSVTRGGGSGPFGAGALSGTIALESADAAALAPVSGGLLVNQRGETEASASVAPRLGSGFAVVSGRWDRGQGFFTTPKDQRVPATARAAFDSWSVGLRGVAPLGPDIELQARGLVFEDDRTLRFEGADSSSSGQDASLRLVGRGDWQFDVLGYVQARNFTNVVISSSRFTRVLDQRNTPSTGLGGKIELRPPLGEAVNLRTGVDYRRSRGELYEDAYSAFSGAITARRNAGGTNTDLGLFADGDWTSGALVLTGGVRADRYTIRDGFYVERDAAGMLAIDERYANRGGWQVSYRGGASLAVGGDLHLRAAAYTGLRLPTLNELYRPFVVFPVVTQANPDLRNERLEGYEAGVRFAPTSGFSLTLTAFENRLENAIANVTIGEDLRQRRNLPAIVARGIEADMGLAAGAFRFDGSLAWTDSEVRGEGDSRELDGMRPSQTPALSASATVAFVPGPGARLAATVRHVGKQYEDDLETEVLPAATTLDLFAELRVAGRLSLVLRGENLTDESIVTRNSGGSIDLGVPRTLWAGLRWGL
ncbi:TonB-dependent receptor [Novosphingobium sp. PC22D]|uniref:TonB-dependent receptor n=1 Tax=Novosphingobium sp. PC22D TaxID=1962403 RepID=UPI001F0AD2AB|nr:TonB-dependent receptor [Novosphingobium sp. PC22D]